MQLTKKSEGFFKKLGEKTRKIVSLSILILFFSVSFSLAGPVDYIVWDILFYGASIFLFWSGVAFDNLLALTLNTGFYDSNFIKIIWTDLRDFANIAFILGLVYIAVSIMLQDVFKVRQNLIKLLIIAFLINFSFFFTRIVIDAGNITALAVYNAIAVESTEVDTNLQFAFLEDNPLLESKSISAGLMAATGYSERGQASAEIFAKIVEDNLARSSEDGDGPIATVGLFFAFLFYQFGKTFLIAAFGFLSRTIWLIMYIIFSPLAFISYFLPEGLDKYFFQWLKGLVSRSFCIAAYLLFVYIIYQFLQFDFLQGQSSTLSLSQVNNVGTVAKVSAATLLLPLVIKSLVIWYLLKTALETSINLCENGKSFLAQAFGAVVKTATMAAPVAGFAAKKGIGYTSRKMLYGANKGKGVGGALANLSKNGNFVTRRFGDAALLGLDKGQKAKFGTKSSYHEESTKARERNVRLKGLRGQGSDGAEIVDIDERTHRRKYTGEFLDTREGMEARGEYQKMEENGFDTLKKNAKDFAEEIKEIQDEIDGKKDAEGNNLSARQIQNRKEQIKDKETAFKKKNYFDYKDTGSIDQSVIDKNLRGIIGRNIEHAVWEPKKGGVAHGIASVASTSYDALTNQENIEGQKDAAAKEKKYSKEKSFDKAASDIRGFEAEEKVNNANDIKKRKKNTYDYIFEGETEGAYKGKETLTETKDYQDAKKTLANIQSEKESTLKNVKSGVALSDTNYQNISKLTGKTFTQQDKNEIALAEDLISKEEDLLEKVRDIESKFDPQRANKISSLQSQISDPQRAARISTLQSQVQAKITDPEKIKAMKIVKNADDNNVPKFATSAQRAIVAGIKKQEKELKNEIKQLEDQEKELEKLKTDDASEKNNLDSMYSQLERTKQQKQRAQNIVEKAFVSAEQDTQTQVDQAEKVLKSMYNEKRVDFDQLEKKKNARISGEADSQIHRLRTQEDITARISQSREDMRAAGADIETEKQVGVIPSPEKNT